MAVDVRNILARIGGGWELKAVSFGAAWVEGEGPTLVVRSPIDGSSLAEFPSASRDQFNSAVSLATRDFAVWRDIPAPSRGELVRRIGNEFRKHEADLARDGQRHWPC